ncbi:MAG: HD family phosphohydrolase [bacterium]
MARRKARGALKAARKALLRWHSSGSGFWIERALMFLVVLAIFNLLYPGRPVLQKVPKQGDIAKENVIAPFTFFIQKPEEELEKERQAAADAVPTVLEFDADRTNKIISEFKSFLSKVSSISKEPKPIQDVIEEISSINPALSAEAISGLVKNKDPKFVEAMVAVLKDVLGRGVVTSREGVTVTGGSKVSVVKSGKEATRGIESVLDSSAAVNLIKHLATQYAGGDERKIGVFVESVSSFVASNLFVDAKETHARREKARSEIATTKGIVLKGEMIVRAHDVVTPEVAEKLRSLEMSKGEMGPPSRVIASTGGQNLLYSMVLGSLGVFLFLFKGAFFKNYSVLVLISLILVLVMALSAVLLRFEGASIYLVPVAIASILVCMLLDVGAAAAVTLVLSIFVAVFAGLRVPGMLVGLFGGLAAVYSVRSINRRYEFYRAVLYISLANVLCILGIELFRLTPLTQILRASGFGVLNAFASTFVAIGLLPLCEHAFGVTTDIRLLELSDLNRPLLKELAMEAPGTFHHSIVVSSLAQAAAEVVGANPLLARVAAYYHDIGKISKPNYFIENQTGRKNPHDELAPRMSGLILASHIKDGVERARKEGLPKAVVDVLREHHGTALMVHFYRKCLAMHPNEGITDVHFRYPGPKPKSKEAAIVMLADSIEAKARSLESPTPSRLRGVVKEIIDERLNEGQLDESDLTLRDLSKISEKFLPVLIGVFHPRLGYPSAEQEKNGNLRARSPGGLRSETGGRKTSR